MKNKSYFFRKQNGSIKYAKNNKETSFQTSRCWSGYLSTHTAMLDSLGYRKLISKALLAHTIAGLCAGIIAHWTFVLVGLIL